MEDMLFSPDCGAQGERGKRWEPLELLRGPRETAEPGLGTEVGTELKDAAGTAETQCELLDHAPPGPHLVPTMAFTTRVYHFLPFVGYVSLPWVFCLL